MIQQLTTGFRAIMAIIKEIADGQLISFDDAWSIVTFYKRNKDTDAFIEYVEDVPVADFPTLLNEVIALQKETSELLHIYKVSKKQFEAFDPKPIYKEHLEPIKSAYEAAKDKSAVAYKEYKEIDNSLDMPELRYSKEELPIAWKQHGEKKSDYDRLSKQTKELFAVYDRERRRTAGLFAFKLSGLVMMAYSLDTMAKALIDDLENFNQSREDCQ